MFRKYISKKKTVLLYVVPPYVWAEELACNENAWEPHPKEIMSYDPKGSNVKAEQADNYSLHCRRNLI